GEVRKGDHGEYGAATLDLLESTDPMFVGLSGRQQVWMSHRDTVERAPDGWRVTGSTSTCKVAAMANPDRGFYAVQFHLEVVHTPRGKEYLSNFVFNVAGCQVDWNPRNRVPLVEQEIRDCVGDRKVFFFVSG